MSLSHLFDLSGRKALVTGAGRGIGRVLALALAEAGADISILEIDLTNAEAVADEIRQLGRAGMIVQADVTQKDQVHTRRQLSC